MDLVEYLRRELELKEYCRKYRFWDDLDNCLACYKCKYFEPLTDDKCELGDTFEYLKTKSRLVFQN